MIKVEAYKIKKWFNFILVLPLLVCWGRAESWERVEVPLEQLRAFPGNWSLAPEEIYYALKHCTYKEKLRILEFGAGAGTKALVDVLKAHHIPFEYHSFENDPAYIQELAGVQFHPYSLTPVAWSKVKEWVPEVKRVDLGLLPVFDLILIDGPHGVSRAEWYAKFKPFTRPGTVLLIDDYHHYVEFEEALNANYTYDTVILYNQSAPWPVVNEGLERASNLSIGKTFKVVVLR